MAEQHIKLNIGSKADLTGFEKIKGAISSIGSKIGNFAKTIGSNLMNIKAGFDMLSSSISKIGSLFTKAFDAESAQAQFKNYIKNTEELADHMKMLQEMGDTPPFSMEEFEKASIALMRMTEGVLGFQDSLTLVGNAAQATGQNLESVADAVGKAYGMIHDGQPVSKAVTQLRNMGIITPKVAAELDNLQKSGASGSDVWSMLEKEISKYKGAMDETLDTGNGLIGAIGSQWDDILRQFGNTVLDVVKGPLKQFLEFLTTIHNNGTVQNIAKKVGGAFEWVSEKIEDNILFVKLLKERIEDLWGGFKGLVTFKGWSAGMNQVWEERSTEGDARIQQQKDEEAARKVEQEKRNEQQIISRYKAERDMLDQKLVKDLEILEAQNAQIRQKEIEDEIKQNEELLKKEEQFREKEYEERQKLLEDEIKSNEELQEKEQEFAEQLRKEQEEAERDMRDKEIKALDSIIDDLKKEQRELTKAINENSDKQKQNIGAVGGDQRKFDRNQQLFQANQDAKANRRTKLFNDRMEKLQDEWKEGKGKIWFDEDGNLTGFRSGKRTMTKRERQELQDFLRGEKLKELARKNEREIKKAEEKRTKRERENNAALLEIKNKFNRFINVQTAN